MPEGDNFIFLSSIIHEYVEEFFPGMTVKGCHQFRVTRNSDLEMSKVEVEDVASALRGELHTRRFGAAAKLEVDKDCPPKLTEFLLNRFNLSDSELFKLDGPVNLQRLYCSIQYGGKARFKIPKVHTRSSFTFRRG